MGGYRATHRLAGDVKVDLNNAIISSDSLSSRPSSCAQAAAKLQTLDESVESMSHRIGELEAVLAAVRLDVRDLAAFCLQQAERGLAIEAQVVGANIALTELASEVDRKVQRSALDVLSESAKVVMRAGEEIIKSITSAIPVYARPAFEADFQRLDKLEALLRKVTRSFDSFTEEKHEWDSPLPLCPPFSNRLAGKVLDIIEHEPGLLGERVTSLGKQQGVVDERITKLEKSISAQCVREPKVGLPAAKASSGGKSSASRATGLIDYSRFEALDVSDDEDDMKARRRDMSEWMHNQPEVARDFVQVLAPAISQIAMGSDWDGTFPDDGCGDMGPFGDPSSSDGEGDGDLGG